jgi:Uma2 family endonuclease
MVERETLLTVEAFDEWVVLPENAEHIFEFIGGEIVEVPSNPYVSHLASRINRRLGNFVEAGDLGYVTDGQGGYMVSGERYAPDVAFISKIRQPILAQHGYNPNPPNLAIEIDFPSTRQTQQELRIKVVNYLAAGTVIWVVYPDKLRVEVYVPGKPVRILGMGDTLDGDEVLPGFVLPVREIFPG